MFFFPKNLVVSKRIERYFDSVKKKETTAKYSRYNTLLCVGVKERNRRERERERESGEFPAYKQ